MRQLTLAIALSLAAVAAHADEQVRTLAPFTSISVQGPVNIVVDAGATQAVSVQGSAKFLQELSSEVVDGELRLRMRNNRNTVTLGEARVVIAMPQLRAFEAAGAGETKLNNIKGERLAVRYRGAGSMRISGAVDTFKMQAEGVGDVDATTLIARNADVRFQGIGDIKVHAKEKLDVAVQGLGSLTYFGKPHTVTKSVAGLGTVRAGD